MRDDAILHIGQYAEGSGKLETGSQANLSIDAEFRKINARIHSAGHLLDVAMNRAGRTDLKPSKGYHFESGPYVEYIGVVPADERAPLAAELAKHCADLIAEATAAKTKVISKICSYHDAQDELKGAGGVPSYIPMGQDLRVLKLVPEDPGCPCGGTHVDSISKIGRIEITKIKKKKKNTQVSYKVTPIDF